MTYLYKSKWLEKFSDQNSCQKKAETRRVKSGFVQHQSHKIGTRNTQNFFFAKNFYVDIILECSQLENSMHF